MAYKRFDKDSLEFKMFNEFWQVFQQFGEVEQTEIYWESLTNRCREFTKKYGEFGKQLMLVTFEELERRGVQNDIR